MWKVEFLWTTSSGAKGVHKSTRAIQQLHSVIVSISHHDGAIRGTTDTIWLIKLSIGLTLLTTTDDLEWLALIREDLHTVVGFFTHQEVVGGGLDTQA